MTTRNLASGNLQPVVPTPDTFCSLRAGYFAGDRRAEVERRWRALAQLLGPEAETLPELALRFCLSATAVTTVIPGMRRPAHVTQNVAAVGKGGVSKGLLSKLQAHAWEKNWYPG